MEHGARLVGPRLWFPVVLGAGAFGLTAVGLLALRSEARVVHVRAAEAAAEAAASTARALDAALARLAERFHRARTGVDLEALEREAPGFVRSAVWGHDGRLAGTVEAAEPSTPGPGRAERLLVETLLEEAAHQEHARGDPAAAAAALEHARKEARDPDLRGFVWLAWAGFERRRLGAEPATSILTELLTDGGIPLGRAAEARAAARCLLVLWKPEAAAAFDAGSFARELALCRPPFARALVAEASEAGLLEGVQRQSLLASIRASQMRQELDAALAVRGVEWTDPQIRAATAAGFLVLLSTDGAGRRRGLVLDPAAFAHLELGEAAAIARAAGFPVEARVEGPPLAFEADVQGFQGLLRVGLPADFEPGAGAPPPWILGGLVVALGVSVLGGAWLLTRAARREVEAASAKSEFLAGVTHELKTPLASIRLYSEMLEEGRVEGSRHAEYVRMIGREAERLTELVDRVLALARAERGARDLSVDDAPGAGEIASAAERAFRPSAEASGLRFTVAIEDARSSLRADEPSLVQALLDLLDNARKYGLDGGEVELRGSLDAAAGRYRFEVLDRGPGLPEGDLERLFTMFARGRGDSVRGKVGLGIGLALSKRILEAQGATLTAGNREGGGAVFRVHVPLAPAPKP